MGSRKLKKGDYVYTKRDLRRGLGIIQSISEDRYGDCMSAWVLWTELGEERYHHVVRNLVYASPLIALAVQARE